MKKNTLLLLIICFVLAWKSEAKADTIPSLLNQMVKIGTKNKKHLSGKVVEENRIQLSIMVNPKLIVEVEKSNIATLELIGNKDIELEDRLIYSAEEEIPIKTPKVIKPKKAKKTTLDSVDNSFASSYIISPSGFNLGKNQFQYKTLDLFFHGMSYGITDFLSIGAGADLLNLPAVVALEGSLTNFVFFNVKLSTSTPDKNVHFSLSSNFVGGDAADDGFALTNNASVTFGNRYNNFTIGLNRHPFNDYDQQNISLALAGQYRLTKKNSIMADFNKAFDVYIFNIALCKYSENDKYIFGVTVVDGRKIPLLGYHLSF
jgi:hypothetical protein